MQLLNTLFSVLLLNAVVLAQSDNVKVHVVEVGLNNSFTFSPNSVTANAGDVVQFQFLSKNHSVVQSTFNSPCSPINTVMSNVTGFTSGFMPVKDSIPVFSILVQDTQPIWAYCSQIGHCAKGMVVAINAPADGSNTFSTFKSLALSTGNSSVNSATTPSNGTAAALSSGTATPATTSGTTSPLLAGRGARPIVDVTLLALLAVFGIFYTSL